MRYLHQKFWMKNLIDQNKFYNRLVQLSAFILKLHNDDGFTFFMGHKLQIYKKHDISITITTPTYEANRDTEDDENTRFWNG